MWSSSVCSVLCLCLVMWLWRRELASVKCEFAGVRLGDVSKWE